MLRCFLFQTSFEAWLLVFPVTLLSPASLCLWGSSTWLHTFPSLLFSGSHHSETPYLNERTGRWLLGSSAVRGACSGRVAGPVVCWPESSLVSDLRTVCLVALLTLARAGFCGPQALSVESACVIDKGLHGVISRVSQPVTTNQY